MPNTIFFIIFTITITYTTTEHYFPLTLLKDCNGEKTTNIEPYLPCLPESNSNLPLNPNTSALGTTKSKYNTASGTNGSNITVTFPSFISSIAFLIQGTLSEYGGFT